MLRWNLACKLVHVLRLVHCLLAVSGHWCSLEELPGENGTWSNQLGFTVAVRALERLVDGASTPIGSCADGQPVLDGAPVGACQDVYCLWSSQTLPLDVYFNLFHPLPLDLAVSEGFECRNVSQGPYPGSKTAVVMSIVVDVDCQEGGGGHWFLQLLRTTSGVALVEYIVMCKVTPSTKFQSYIRFIRSTFPVTLHVYSPGQVSTSAALAMIATSLQGEYVAILSSSIVVLRGWLFPIVELLGSRPDVGGVSPLVVTRDQLVAWGPSLLDEGGGLMFPGRNLQVDHHPITYTQSQDVLLSEAMVLRRNLLTTFLQPGIEEETDNGQLHRDVLGSIAVTRQGHLLLYAPLSVVMTTQTTLPGSGQEPTASVATFTDPQPVLGGWGATQEARRGVLWVDYKVPEGDRDSGSVRILAIMKILLAQGLMVDFLPAWNKNKDTRYAAQLRHAGVGLLNYTASASWESSFGAKCKYDIIILSRRQVFHVWYSKVRYHCPASMIIYDTVDLDFLRQVRVRLSEEGADSWDTCQITDITAITDKLFEGPARTRLQVRAREELSYVAMSNLTWVVSDVEQRLLARYNPAPLVHVLSNIYEEKEVTGSCESRHGLVFVGSSQHVPNQQALRALIRDVLPLVRRKMTGVSVVLHVVGISNWSLVQDHNGASHEPELHDVVFHGHLSNAELHRLYQKVRVAVAPILSGAGVKGKVNQAMQYGVPVVATPVAVEGMQVTHGVHAMVASTPQEFADAIVKLSRDCVLWRHMSVGGLGNVREHFSVDVATRQVRATLARAELMGRT